jgi:hypothetical protein
VSATTKIMSSQEEKKERAFMFARDVLAYYSSQNISAKNNHRLWSVEMNTGTTAELVSGNERQIVLRPDDMSAVHFLQWLSPGCRVDDLTFSQLPSLRA